MDTSNGNHNGKRPNFEASIEQQDLCKMLLKLEVGETLPYEDASNLIKGNVRAEKRHILQSARQTLLRQHQRVFGIIQGKGIYRMRDMEIVASSNASLSAIHRASIRAVRKLACAEFDALDNEHKIKHHVAASMLGMLAYTTSTSRIQKIENLVSATPKQLEIEETLKSLQ
jgi:hypothetical protein